MQKAGHFVSASMCQVKCSYDYSVTNVKTNAADLTECQTKRDNGELCGQHEEPQDQPQTLKKKQEL